MEQPTVYVFYDYVCPYAYAGKLRADVLQERFDVALEWLPWEIHPTADPRGTPRQAAGGPGWVDTLLAELDGTRTQPSLSMNSNLALRLAEAVKDHGEEAFGAYHTAAFDAVWQEGRNLGDEAVLRDLVTAAGLEPDALLAQARHPAYDARLKAVDRAAEALGVQRVPTFVFGDQRIVGNDPFGDSLEAPLRAFLDRWKTLGPDGCTTLAEDVGLDYLLLG